MVAIILNDILLNVLYEKRTFDTFQSITNEGLSVKAINFWGGIL